MYKLLATTAIVMAVATPSFAWTDAKTLITNLNTVYTGVDGQDQFNNLQGNGGALNNFLGDVNAGVTHISLTVGLDNNITATLNEGKSLVEIEESAGSLVNRVNFDLFHDTTPGDADDAGFDADADYASLSAFGITKTTTDSKVTHGTESGIGQTNGNGLVGAKVNTIVTSANTINNGLINQTSEGAAAANQGFLDAYNGNGGAGLDETHYGVNIAGFKADITEINTSVNAASGASFFSNTAGFKVDGTSNSAFATPGFTLNESDGGISDGTNSYDSLLAWATAPVAP